MKFLLIQLSDIHFQTKNNSVLEKQDKLFEAIRNSTLDYESIYLVVTGDSAFSGSNDEYEVAYKFLKGLVDKLKQYSNKEVNCLVIPGNHDCNFEKDTKARQNQINIVQKLGDSAIDESVINQCAEVQSEYFSFREKIQSGLTAAFQNKLLSVYQFEVQDKKIVFYCYNSAYMSEIKEQPAKLFYSLAQLPENPFTVKADLFISLFHHPFHWLNPVNRREFSSHIYKTSDFYLTGHEHEFSKSKIDDLEENTVYHIEGSVLQNSENIFESEFNLIGFDIEKESFKIEKYFWNDGKYQQSNEMKDWANYKRGKIKLKTKYDITLSFARELDDIGGKFSHPNKSDIKLSDLYIFPSLRYFNAKENSEDNVSYILENAESVIKNLKTESKVLLFGGESIGKTALLRTAYKLLYNKGLIPVYIDGHLIKNSGIGEFKKLVEKSFIQQYGESSLEDFEQEDVANIVIMIDDIDKNPLKNQKAKGRFLKGLQEFYRNIILVGNELFAIAEIVSDEEVKGDLFSSFHQYEIMEFNHSMRAKLIQRWYTLGNEDFISDEETYRKCDKAFLAINTAMGQRIVPNYPIFLLILLQALETSNPHDLQISSYGNYYQLLILKTLTDNIREQSELNTYQNYCGELAHYFFKKRTSSISLNEHSVFHKDISSYEKFDLPATLTGKKALDTLCKVGVLDLHGDDIKFKYQYTFFYFEAKYLAQHLADDSIKEIVSKLCQRLYRSEFANILMFLIHFSKDDFIIQELIKNAREIFQEFSPCKLENDIGELNKLVAELPKLYLKNKTVEENRDEENKAIDEEEAKQNFETGQNLKTWDLDEDTSVIDVVSKLNLSFKLTEILGQVVKNHGSLSGPLKLEMLKETYLMGLRTLNIFFSVLNENTDFILNQLKEILSKFKNVEQDKIEKTARHLLFSLCTQISFTFVKKVSDSVGSNNLMDKYPRIQEELDFSSVKLINFLIKLEHTGGFPHRELETIKDSIERYPMSYFLLRRMVVNHLHRHPVDYKDRQRICTFLGIPIETQLQIDTDRKKQDKSE